MADNKSGSAAHAGQYYTSNGKTYQVQDNGASKQVSGLPTNAVATGTTGHDGKTVYYSAVENKAEIDDPNPPKTPSYNYSYGGGGGGGSSSPAKEWEFTDDNGQGLKDISPDTDTKKLYQEKIDQVMNANLDSMGAKVGRVDNVDTAEQEAILNQIKASQEQQATNQIDYAVNKGVTDLQRAEEDAQQGFQTQRNQISRDEQRALDNQVLYNEARGDRGGVGQAQYNSIQNTAAVNRLTVNSAQKKLATDTQRQIADLRAQGEFDKADKMLSISQNYLAQLMDLKQWADSTNVSIDEFNISVEQWEANYNQALLEAQLNAANTLYTNEQALYQQLAAAGQALLQAGVAPTAQQLQAMGWTQDQAKSYLKRYYPDGPK